MDAPGHGELIGSPGSALAAHAPPSVAPDALDARFFGFFSWYVRRLLRRSFFAVRIERSGEEALRALAPTPRPAIVAMTHPSWWDPLVGVLLSATLHPGRPPLAPLDRAQWERFGFMKKIGLFGVDPDDPRVLSPMVDHVLARLREERPRVLWITPQGRFSDPREPISIRPGVAAVAARLENPAVVALAIEYAFWTDKRAEVLVRAAPVEVEGTQSRRSTADWHRAIQSSMQANADALADLVVARDPAPFRALVGGDATRINPLYDLWLALRGRRGAIDDRREGRGS